MVVPNNKLPANHVEVVELLPIHVLLDPVVLTPTLSLPIKILLLAVVVDNPAPVPINIWLLSCNVIPKFLPKEDTSLDYKSVMDFFNARYKKRVVRKKSKKVNVEFLKKIKVAYLNMFVREFTVRGLTKDYKLIEYYF